MLVFRIEKQYESSEFVGGSNRPIIDDINKLGSGEIPIETHDFVSIQRTWLDIVKCVVFLGCFWITLAIVFLAGTNHMNIFSIGYLIGSFIFLWQGADFYLRPIHTILQWWRYLVAYNIFVITMKIILHLPVCIFIKFFEKNRKDACFLKIFGITCTRSIDLFSPPQVRFKYRKKHIFVGIKLPLYSEILLVSQKDNGKLEQRYCAVLFQQRNIIQYIRKIVFMSFTRIILI